MSTLDFSIRSGSVISCSPTLRQTQPPVVRQRVEGGLDTFTGTNHHRAAAGSEFRQRRKDRPAVDDGAVRLDDRELAKMVMDA